MTEARTRAPIVHPILRLVLLGGIALLFVVGLDLAIHAALGYRLRTDRVRLLLLEAIGILPVAAALGLAAFLVERWRRVPARWPSIPAVLIVLALFVLSIAFALSRPLRGADQLRAPGPAVVGGGPNVILIVLDTVRADHTSLHGYARDTTPFLAELGARSSVFDNAVSASSYTLPAHASLFTGLHPETHGAYATRPGEGITLSDLGLDVNEVAVRPLGPGPPTLAERLRDAGLATGAICANTAYLYRAFGLDRGFDTYVDARPLRVDRRPLGLRIGQRVARRLSIWPLRRALFSNDRYGLFAAEVNALARRWVEARSDRSFFLFLNYMDAHDPYLPVGTYRSLFPAASEDYRRVDRDAVRSGERGVTASEWRRQVDPYDAELRYLDDRLRELFAWLEDRGVLERSIVVIAGDHGESFGEHRTFWHGSSLHEEQVRIPLLVRIPGQREGRRIRRRVHIVDVLPTLVQLLDLPMESALQGTSLFSSARERPVVIGLGEFQRDYAEHAIYRDHWKLVVRSDGARRLYDLAADPDERVDLASARPVAVHGLAEDLDRFLESVPRHVDRAGPVPVDAQTIERLRALGYVD